jgi:hypothetical protein
MATLHRAWHVLKDKDILGRRSERISLLVLTKRPSRERLPPVVMGPGFRQDDSEIGATA